MQKWVSWIQALSKAPWRTPLDFPRDVSSWSIPDVPTNHSQEKQAQSLSSTQLCFVMPLAPLLQWYWKWWFNESRDADLRKLKPSLWCPPHPPIPRPWAPTLPLSPLCYRYHLKRSWWTNVWRNWNFGMSSLHTVMWWFSSAPTPSSFSL